MREGSEAASFPLSHTNATLRPVGLAPSFSVVFVDRELRPASGVAVTRLRERVRRDFCALWHTLQAPTESTLWLQTLTIVLGSPDASTSVRAPSGAWYAHRGPFPGLEADESYVLTLDELGEARLVAPEIWGALW
jgi:hypothetical protein